MGAVRSPFRVTLQSLDATFAPSSTVAIIDDAREVGASEYANEPGEFYMTLPYNHIAVSSITTWLTRYRVQRATSGNPRWVNIASGIIDDFDATENDVVVYGTDFLGLFDLSITASSTTYTSTTTRNIIIDQLTQAMGETNSRTQWIALGTIDTASSTFTVISAKEPRLSFLRNVLAIDSSDESVRSIIQVSRSTPFQVNYTRNQGQDRPEIPLTYGGLVNGFRFSPGGTNFATGIESIGIKREGASVLYSSQTGISEATYGRIRRAQVFQDIVNQAALDARTKRAARRAARLNQNAALALRSNQLQPWDGYDLGDSFYVKINRGIVNLNNRYTLWGQEFKGHVDGSSELYLSLLPKDI